MADSCARFTLLVITCLITELLAVPYLHHPKEAKEFPREGAFSRWLLLGDVSLGHTQTDTGFSRRLVSVPSHPCNINTYLTPFRFVAGSPQLTWTLLMRRP